ncbi:MAG: lysophospholipid acyltransferase family protein [bacterium]
MITAVLRSAVVFMYAVFASFRALFFAPVRRLGFKSYTDKFVENFYKDILSISGVVVEVEGLENIDPEKHFVIFSNHQSMLDIPVVGAVFPGRTRIIAKKELKKVPFFGWSMWFYDFVFIDRRNKKKAVRALKQASELLKKYSIIIFPEGTRSIDGKVSSFKTGGISLAKKAKVGILPVAVSGTRELLPKSSFLMKKGNVRVKIFPPVYPDGEKSKNEIATTLQNEIKNFVDENQTGGL